MVNVMDNFFLAFQIKSDDKNSYILLFFVLFIALTFHIHIRTVDQASLHPSQGGLTFY